MGLSAGTLARAQVTQSGGYCHPTVRKVREHMERRGVRKLVLEPTEAVALGLRTGYADTDSLTVRRSTSGPWQVYTVGHMTYVYWLG